MRRVVTSRSGRSPGLRGGSRVPGPSHRLTDSGLQLQIPLTVALPRRFFTAFPILPGWAPERGVVCVYDLGMRILARERSVKGWR